MSGNMDFPVSPLRWRPSKKQLPFEIVALQMENSAISVSLPERQGKLVKSGSHASSAMSALAPNPASSEHKTRASLHFRGALGLWSPIEEESLKAATYCRRWSAQVLLKRGNCVWKVSSLELHTASLEKALGHNFCGRVSVKMKQSALCLHPRSPPLQCVPTTFLVTFPSVVPAKTGRTLEPGHQESAKFNSPLF